MLVAVIVFVVLAGFFFRDGDTPIAQPPSSAAPTPTSATTPTSVTTPVRPTLRTGVPSVDADGLPTIAVADLPAQAQEIYRLLLTTGPFEYTKDGTVFGNREGLLPSKPNGYYREFTVETPGATDRGARRLVVGGCGRQTSTQPVRITACSTTNPIYWTDDHYESFRRVL